jgi:flagellar protein FliJ
MNQFRLSSLLRIRQAARDELRAALAEMHRVDDLLRERRGRVDAELDALRDVRRQAVAPGPIDLDRLAEFADYETALGRQQAELSHQQQIVAQEIHRRREALLEADREVRALEKLRETQAERYRQDDQRQESKRLDEIAHTRRQAAEAVQ